MFLIWSDKFLLMTFLLESGLGLFFKIQKREREREAREEEEEEEEKTSLVCTARSHQSGQHSGSKDDLIKGFWGGQSGKRSFFCHLTPW